MEKEDILEISRREHQNRDLAELEASVQAGNLAGRVGAGVCCLVSALFVRAVHTVLLGPWVISFSRYARAGEVLKAEAEDRSRPHGLIPCHVPALSGLFYPAADGGGGMKAELKLQNRLKEARCEKGLSQSQLAELVGVSRNTISSIETGQFNPTAKLALILCIALDQKFEDLFYF